MTSNAPDRIRQIIAEERALAILCFLNGPLNRSGSDGLLSRCLALYALHCGRDQLRDDLGKLERAGLVTLDEQPNLILVVITSKGVEAAEGTIHVEGVARSGPDCPYR